MLPLWRLKGMALPATGWVRLIALAGIYIVGVVVIVAIFALLGWRPKVSLSPTEATIILRYMNSGVFYPNFLGVSDYIIKP